MSDGDDLAAGAGDPLLSGRSDDPARDNGLQAAAYVALTDVDEAVGQHLLEVLGRARIAAYLDPIGDSEAHGAARRRLFVASDERGDARTIVATAARALGAPVPPPSADPLLGADTDAAFAAIVAGWHVDTVAAVRDAERDLSREDADWRTRLPQPGPSDQVPLEDDHYVPPAPPPLPRLAKPTITAIVVLVVSLSILGFGGFVGLTDRVCMVLGIGGLLVAAGILLTRVREQHRDEDDDGSAV